MDPKVNELLATIRKSVEGDVNSVGGEARGTLMRGALREMRVRIEGEPPAEANISRSAVRHEELSRLRERILRNVERNELLAASQPAPQAAPQPAGYRQQPGEAPPNRNDFSSIMALSPPQDSGPELRRGYVQQEEDDLRYHQEQQWNEAPQAMRHSGQQGGYQEPLLSGHAEAATEQAFRLLSDTLLTRAAGDRNLEEMTRDMLRGMIKQWLDANLAIMVEGLVREEIERVSRKGR